MQRDTKMELIAQIISMFAGNGKMPSYPWNTPEEYVPNLTTPNQQGSMPTTPHPLDELNALMQRRGIPETDSGMSQGYNEAIMQDLMRGTIPGHLYNWIPRTEDPYAIDPGLPPLGGANQENWYPGSGSIERDDYFGDPEAGV